MLSPPKCYEDWLTLSDRDRKRLHFEVWNVYDRDGIGFAYTAAGRLAAQSPFEVYDVKIGTYHCGEYILELSLHPNDFLKAPGMFEQTFEGFRVRYAAEDIFVIEEFANRDLCCPICCGSFKEFGSRSAGMQHDGSYIINCNNCPAAHIYDSDFNLIKTIE